MLALAVLAVAGWLAACAAVWAYVKFERGHAAASYTDLVLFPWRGAHFRAGLAHYYVERGETEIRLKRYVEGYRYLRAGLARLPADLTVRRTVATWELRFGLPYRALETLMGGVERAAHDLDYLKIVFALMLETREEDRVLTLAAEMLPARPDDALVHRFVALQAATAHYTRGRYTEAERILADWSLSQSLEGVVLQARCDWERGYPLLALARLETEIPRFPRRDELYVELIGLHRRLGHFEEARRMAVLRRLNDPAGPGPRISLLQMYRSSGDAAAEGRELEAFLRDFSQDPRMLTLLAWHAVETHQPALLERVCALARQQDFSQRAFNLARIELAMALQDYARARTLATAALTAVYEKEDDLPVRLRALRALALVGLGDTAAGRLELRAYKDNTHLHPSDLLNLGRQLRSLGLPDLAREFLVKVVNYDSLNEQALAELVRLDAGTGHRAGLAASLPKLLRFPKPPRAVLEETLLQLNAPGDGPLRTEVLAVLGRLPAAATPRRRRHRVGRRA